MTLKLTNRKTIRIGNSVLLTLPPEWIIYHQLKGRDLLELQITDDEAGRLLILKPIKDVSSKTDKIGKRREYIKI